MTGLERAVWWIEYVIRHKGAHHLKNPALSMPWYQYYLLDIICFVVAAVFTLVLIVMKFLVLTDYIAKLLVRQKLKTV